VSSRRIGVLGGTFDPPHIGHLVAAVNALETLSLTEVLLVVSNFPWQKADVRKVSPVEVRFELVAAAVEGRAGLRASDVEVHLGGESQIVRTLGHLRAVSPGDEFFLVVGADAAAGIPTWRSPELLAGLATLAVVRRPGADVDLGFWGGELVLVDSPLLDVSSTDLRERVRSGRRIDFLVPDAVADLVRSRGLYTPGSEGGR
jgi:nicotinate-nucleotide adenylyltransferase